jgi:hypothetical protein
MFVHEKTIRRFLPSESFKDLKTLFSTISEMTQISQDIRNIELMNPNISKDEVYEAESSRYLDMLNLLSCHGLGPEDFNHWLLVQIALMDLEDGRSIES